MIELVLFVSPPLLVAEVVDEGSMCLVLGQLFNDLEEVSNVEGRADVLNVIDVKLLLKVTSYLVFHTFR